MMRPGVGVCGLAAVRASVRAAVRAAGKFLLTTLWLTAAGALAAEPKVRFLAVDDVQVGMQGVGKTVLQGTELVEFRATVLGVLRGVAAGRDVVLCRLAGANLEYTGVIAGMSGSPVYFDGKLLGAVAFTWQFNKEPIAGITPIQQMQSLSARPTQSRPAIALEADGAMPLASLDLSADPCAALRQRAQQSSTAVAVSSGTAPMVPLAVPLAASGFSPRTLAELKELFSPLGMIPVAAGGMGKPSADLAKKKDRPEGKSAPAAADQEAARTALVPGASMAASLVTGDFDLSGIGTVTHVEGDRVWGWGHPFMESGRTQYLLRNGYIHLVNPKLDLSTKMGSPLAVLGVVDADVSTCIAGKLQAQVDLLPLTISLKQGSDPGGHRYQVQIVRQPELLGSLISAVLGNVLDAEGNLDQEITLNLDAQIDAEGLEPIKFRNTFSGAGISGSQGAKGLLNQVAVVADALMRNPFAPTRLKAIRCDCQVTTERTSAAITNVRLNSDQLEPGDELVAHVTLLPYKSAPQSVELRLRLPEHLPPGNYNATICDCGTHLKNRFNEEQHLLVARSVPEVARVFRLQLAERREDLFLRVLLPDSGLAVERVAMPDLPSNVRVALESRRATPPLPIRQVLVSRQNTPWVVEGNTTLRFAVVRNKEALR